jgi:hypothetical protein
MKIKATHSSPAVGDVTVVSGRYSVAWSRSLTKVRVGSSPLSASIAAKLPAHGAQRYQEQERNRSSDCSGTYPNCCQLPPTDPSCSGDSLFLQLSGWWR